MALKIGQLIVEFNLHPHRSKRLDEVRHARQHEAGTKFNDHLRSGIDHPIAQSALKHADDAPYSGFGTVFSAQPDRAECSRRTLGCTYRASPTSSSTGQRSHARRELADHFAGCAALKSIGGKPTRGRMAAVSAWAGWRCR